MFELVIIGAIVNVAASVVFLVIQPRLEKLRVHKPIILALLGPLLLVSAAALVVAASKISAVDFRASTFAVAVPIPVLRPNSSLAEPVGLLSALILSLTVITAAFVQNAIDAWMARGSVTRGEDLDYRSGLSAFRFAEWSLAAAFAVLAYKILFAGILHDSIYSSLFIAIATLNTLAASLVLSASRTRFTIVERKLYLVERGLPVPPAIDVPLPMTTRLLVTSVANVLTVTCLTMNISA